MSEDHPVPVRVTVHIPADDGERFAPGTLDRIIGQVVPLTIGGQHAGNVRVISADIDPDGGGFTLVYEPGPAS